MEISPAVFATDQVNRDRMRIPASELMRAYQRDVEKSIRTGIALGLPMHMQHDMHRLVGWSRPLGLYVDSSMVRVLGQFEKPILDDEKANLDAMVEKYWARHHSEGAEPYGNELMARLAPANLDAARLLTMEAVVVSRAGIAAELYPNLFTPGHDLVDKDGLADYRDLLHRTKQIQPGVFHDPERDVLLFAHRFFRRSLSHRNKLNTYFLQSFSAVTNKSSGLRVRIKLDPDIIGHPGSARELIEMEYWHGPQYNDDIATIPSGVAEHKADARSREYHGIDRTHIWWKDPETRKLDGEELRYRTFEIEELIENESWGIGSDMFGCRYAHAEFSADDAAITHFDGAIRAYGAEAYFERIDTSIDKAGKHAEYTKVFRLDGVLQISDWKRLLSDYFQGNALIPEYLGASVDIEERASPVLSQEGIQPVIEEAKLVALISLARGTITPSIALYPELYQQYGDDLVAFVEVGVGAVEVYLRTRLNLEMTTTVGFKDGILNLSRLCFGPAGEPNEVFSREVEGLSTALRQDVDAGLIRSASIPLTWSINGLLITLTIAGEAGAVADALLRLPDVIDLSCEPSEWVEAISDLVKKIAPRTSSPVIWNGVSRGVLSIGRSGVVEQRIRMPEKLRRHLVASGSLTIRNDTEAKD